MGTKYDVIIKRPPELQNSGMVPGVLLCICLPDSLSVQGLCFLRHESENCWIPRDCCEAPMKKVTILSLWCLIGKELHHLRDDILAPLKAEGASAEHM